MTMGFGFILISVSAIGFIACFIIMVTNYNDVGSPIFLMLFGPFLLFFLIVGIVIVIVSRKKQKAVEKGSKFGSFDEIEKKFNWFCYKCDAEISESDKTCPKCGVEFEG